MIHSCGCEVYFDGGLDRCPLHDAALDLLAALKEYLDWHEANFALPSGNFEDPDQMTLARSARAAIAKAEGGA